MFSDKPTKAVWTHEAKLDKDSDAFKRFWDARAHRPTARQRAKP